MSGHTLTTKEVDNCQFHTWYPAFSSITFKSKIVPLPDNFFDYLNEDSVFMPVSLKPLEEDKSNYSSHNFSEFEGETTAALEEFGGKGFAKLNWKAPKDASWVVPELKCTSMTQVYQALKCSDLVKANFTDDIYEGCTDKEGTVAHSKTYLVLRRWHQLKEWMEFRCFVYNGKLTGISQRNCAHQYLQISQDTTKIVSHIKEFYEKHLKGKFPNTSYVFDVYVDIPPKYRVWLIDFNPWESPLTDPLLFSWEELRTEEEELKFKFVEDESYGTKVSSDPMAKHRFPIVFLCDKLSI